MNRTTEIYCSLDQNRRFRFPEQEYLNIDNNKISVAISGGGTRTMVAAMGHFRALLRKFPDFLEKVSYCSTVSGGSWVMSIITFARVCLGELIGDSVPLESMTREKLMELNYKPHHSGDHHSAHQHYNFEYRYLGNVISNCPTVDVLMTMLLKGESLPHMWEMLCSHLFLRPYDLQLKYITHSRESSVLNHHFNRMSCVYPNKKVPFWIGLSAILDSELIHKNAVALEFTPMYSGVRVPHQKYGGFLFGNGGFGCDFQEVDTLDDHLENVVVQPQYSNFLETQIGASSAAFGTEAVKIKESSQPFHELVARVGPKTLVWGPESTQAHEINLTDGGFHDYTGIIPLVARGCKKILAFLNCDRFEGNYCSFGVTHLFGLDDQFKCYACELRDKMKVFSVHDWVQMRHEFEERLERTGLAFFHRKMQVLHNFRAGVNGGYEAEVLMIPLFPSRNFDKKCSFDYKSPHHPDLNDMPNVSYIFGFNGSVLELTNSQVNFLSTFTDFQLTEIMEYLPEFFEELETTTTL